MSQDDWSVVEEWTVVNSNVTSSDEEWSLLRSINDDHGSVDNSVVPTLMSTDYPHYITVPYCEMNRKEGIDHDKSATDEDCSEPFHNKREYGGKRALSHSLVKRCECMGFRTVNESYEFYYDDLIEVVNRPRDTKGQWGVTTALDEVLPELVRRGSTPNSGPTATLGRANRWNDIKDYLYQLEEGGTAERVATEKLFGRHPFSFGPYSNIPHQAIHFRVKPLVGGSFEDGVEYALHQTARNKSTEASSLQRKYSAKAGRNSDEVKSKRRARRKAEHRAIIKECLQER